MSDLDADIARIAALRGHDPRMVKAKAQEIDSLTSRITKSEVENLFVGMPQMLEEIDAFDGLPPASRRFIRECALNVSAVKFAGALLKADHREAELIALAEAHADTTVSQRKAQRLPKPKPTDEDWKA